MMNISKPIPGTFLHHEPPQEVVDTWKVIVTEAEAQIRRDKLLTANVLKFFNVLAPLEGTDHLKEIFFEENTIDVPENPKPPTKEISELKFDSTNKKGNDKGKKVLKPSENDKMTEEPTGKKTC